MGGKETFCNLLTGKTLSPVFDVNPDLHTPCCRNDGQLVRMRDIELQGGTSGMPGEGRFSVTVVRKHKIFWSSLDVPAEDGSHRSANNDITVSVLRLLEGPRALPFIRGKQPVELF